MIMGFTSKLITFGGPTLYVAENPKIGWLPLFAADLPIPDVGAVATRPGGTSCFEEKSHIQGGAPQL